MKRPVLDPPSATALLARSGVLGVLACRVLERSFSLSFCQFLVPTFLSPATIRGILLSEFRVLRITMLPTREFLHQCKQLWIAERAMRCPIFTEGFWHPDHEGSLSCWLTSFDSTFIFDAVQRCSDIGGFFESLGLSSALEILGDL